MMAFAFLYLYLVAMILAVIGMAKLHMKIDQVMDDVEDDRRSARAERARQRQEREKTARANEDLAAILTLAKLPRPFEDGLGKGNGRVSVRIREHGEDQVEVIAWEHFDDDRDLKRLADVKIGRGDPLAGVLLEINKASARNYFEPVECPGKPASATLAAMQRHKALEHLPRLVERYGDAVAEACGA